MEELNIMEKKRGIRRISNTNFACDSCNSIFRVKVCDGIEKINCPNCEENMKLEDFKNGRKKR